MIVPLLCFGVTVEESMPMPLPPNHDLRAAIKEHGYTLAGLAEAINDAAERLTGVRGSCSVQLIGLWLRGEVAWPRDYSRIPLEHVLGRPAEQLGFQPPQSALRGRTVRTSAPAQNQEPPVERRTFVLGLTGSMLALPTLPESGRLGMTDVGRIHTTLVKLHHLDDQYGGTQVVGAAARYIDYVEHSARRCTYGSQVQTALYQALGGMACSAGWFAFDAKQQAGARRWWDAGLRYALLARDKQLQARIWSSMSHQAYHLGHSGEAVSIARAALDETRGRRDGRLSSLLHTRVAQGHSLQGEAGWCGRSLLRAEQEYDRGPSDQSWLHFYNPGEVHSAASLCYRNLGQHAKSVDAAREALSVIQATALRRNQLAAHARLGRCLLSAGEPDEAIASGDKALDLMSDVESPRITMRVKELRDNLLEASVPGATDFSERYEAVAE